MMWLEAKKQFLEQLSSASTRKGYSQNLLQFEQYLATTGLLMPFQMDAVTKEHINMYLHHLETEKQCKASTSQRYYYALSSFFTYAWEKEWIAFRPTIGVELKTPDKNKPVFITKRECHELIQQIQNPVIAMAVLCQFETGLRVAECLALKIDDISFLRNRIFVKEGKGSKDRFVPMNSAFSRKLANYLKHDRPPVEGSYVFATKRTGKLSSAYLNREIKKAVQALGWEQHITCHTLRHSYASHHLNGGVPIVQIQRWLGHESLASTGVYAHLELDRENNQLVDI